jgi:hypothetical protein
MGVGCECRYATALARECCFAVADNDGSVALEALEAVDGGCIFLSESATEFVADGAEKAGHNGALSAPFRKNCDPCLMGILLKEGMMKTLLTAITLVVSCISGQCQNYQIIAGNAGKALSPSNSYEYNATAFDIPHGYIYLCIAKFTPPEHLDSVACQQSLLILGPNLPGVASVVPNTGSPETTPLPAFWKVDAQLGNVTFCIMNYGNWFCGGSNLRPPP